MSTVPTPAEAQRRKKVLLVAFLAADTLLVGLGLATVLYLAHSNDPPEPPPPEPVTVRVEPPPEPEAPAPAPSPLAGADGGYGRPAPILGPTPVVVPPGNDWPTNTTGDSRIEVRAVGGDLGQGGLPGRWNNPYPRVHMVVFTDFQCPYCARLDATFQELHRRYPTQIELHFRDFPLAFHANARQAHLAARCADDQGRFWPMHDLLMANQRALELTDLRGYARQLGLDTDRFGRCVTEAQHAAEVDADIAAGTAAGVTGTPATFVNGTEISGSRPLESFVALIEQAL
ncbi:MAG: DsbA family protein [Pseudomonadota bacterium]